MNINGNDDDFDDINYDGNVEDNDDDDDNEAGSCFVLLPRVNANGGKRTSSKPQYE